METIIIAIRDLKADAFGKPHGVHNDATAIRTFSDEINSNDKKSLISTHPHDFALYKIATYEEQTGKITPIYPPKLLINGDQCVNPQTTIV